MVKDGIIVLGGAHKLPVNDIRFIEEYIPFYGKLHLGEQELLMSSITWQVINKGEKISKQTDKCSGLVLVKQGRIRAYIMSEDGREITLFRLSEKDICLLSAFCLFDNLDFTVHFAVEKESIIYKIPATVFEEISAYNIYVKEYMLETMASRFAGAMWVMEQVVFGSLSKRVSSFILEQAEFEDSLTLTITHEEIAKNIGSAREVVSRMLKHMESEQIINMARGTIFVNNIEKLKELAK